jgi:uncharacterized membrane protein YfcA
VVVHDDTNLIMVWYSATTVGTDLLYAATKMGGIYVHHKKKNINWTITAWLSLGSVPAALLTVDFTYYKNRHHSFERQLNTV